MRGKCPLLAQSDMPVAAIDVRFWGKSGHRHTDARSRSITLLSSMNFYSSVSPASGVRKLTNA
jgi:hypothetical protein